MRLNRGTIVLFVAALAIIIAVLVLDSQKEANVSETVTATGTAEALFPQFVDSAVVRFEIQDNIYGQQFVAARDDADAAWRVGLDAIDPQDDDSDANADIEVDQTRVDNIVNTLLGASISDGFDAEKLADFGLVNPQYTIYLRDAADKVVALHVGNRNPNSTRYYVAVEEVESEAELILGEVPTTEEELMAMPTGTPVVTLDGGRKLSLIQLNIVDGAVSLLFSPPLIYPTSTPTPYPTANPFSEVDQTATAAAEFTATQAAFDEVLATATNVAESITDEATAEATPDADDTTPEAEATDAE